MVLPYAEVMKLESTFTSSWTERDVMLYALALGMPSDPLDERELAYVYEQNLAVLPSFLSTVVLGRTPVALAGVDYTKVLHGEQAVTVHKPVPTQGEAIVRARMLEAWDKGPGKGAVFADMADLFLPGDDTPFATISNAAFGRAEGGFGGRTGGQPAPHPVPQRAPDRSLVIATLRQQALLYRQTGDLNPLHVDPATARAAGFREPILHGLCTFGICQRAVLATWCGFAPNSLKHFGVRFAGIVYPGESLRVDMWQDGDVISFEAHVVERQQKAISNGMAVLATI